MNELGTVEELGPDGATEPPEDIFPPGTSVRADLMIRPDWIGRTDQPNFLPEFEFVVGTGEGWVLDWDHPQTTHVVTRYRLREDGQGLETW